MIVCVCKAVSDRAIRRAAADGVDSFDDLQFELGVGTCCGKCEPMAREVHFAARLEAIGRPAQPDTHHAVPLRFMPRPSSREIALA